MAKTKKVKKIKMKIYFFLSEQSERRKRRHRAFSEQNEVAKTKKDEKIKIKKEDKSIKRFYSFI